MGQCPALDHSDRLSVPSPTWASFTVPTRTLGTSTETAASSRGTAATVTATRRALSLLKNLERVNLAHVWPLKGLEAIARLSSTAHPLATTIRV